MKCWAGWLTSWNQDCWEKYQQLQICRWYHFNGRKWKLWLIFNPWASKSLQTAGHKIKRHLLLGRRTMTNLDSILKSRDIALLTKACIVKAMASAVVTYWCKNWTIKKAAAAAKSLQSCLTLCEELMLFNCGTGKDSCKSLGQQGFQTSQSSRKSVLNIHWRH